MTQAIYDLPAQQKKNGRETAGRVTIRHKNGDVLQITGYVRTAVTKAQDAGHLTGDQADAIRYCQIMHGQAENLQSVRMEKIRVDGGKVDIGDAIEKKIEAERFLRAAEKMVPPVIYMNTRDLMLFTGDVYKMLLLDYEHPVERLGAIYRPDLTCRKQMLRWGYRSIRFVGECVEGVYMEIQGGQCKKKLTNCPI